MTAGEQELSAATIVAVDEATEHSPFSLVRLWKWALEMARFLVVGGVAFVVDMGLFNLLVFGPGQVLGNKTTTANIISVTTATIVSWVGNRYWTFKDRRTERQGRAMVIYAAINVVGALVPIGTVALTHYTFGLTSALAMNAAKVIGIVLGTALRYVGYKLWVFTAPADVVDDEAAKTAATQL